MNRDASSTTTLRLPPSSVASKRRWTAGLTVSLEGRVAGAIVETTGTGLSARVEVVATSESMLPPTVASALSELCHSSNGSLAQLATLPAQLVPTQCEVIDALVAEACVPREDVIAVGVEDPGIWDVDGQHRCYLGLCDAARLAEASGCNVIDAFAARDVASGGLGGPLTAVAEWLLLAELRRPTVVLHLEDTVHATLLPPRVSGDLSKQLAALEVGPGMQLLNRLSEQLTAGTGTRAAGVRLAEQGRCLAELLADWLADAYFDRAQPRWHPRGAVVDEFEVTAISKATAGGWSVADVLCTATHFIAEATARSVRSQLSRDTTIGKIVCTGPGQDNGLLLQALEERFSDIPQVRSAELGLPGAHFLAAGTALLALLHIDQVPATQTSTTRITVPRVLGRLTPGGPKSWHRLLSQAADARPQVMSLRAAM